MAGFLSNAQNIQISGLMATHHDTFARPLSIFVTPEETVISSDPNFNFTYRPSPNNLNVQIIPKSTTLNCRIMYGDNGGLKNLFQVGQTTDNGNEEIRADIAKGLVRIKFNIADLSWFKDIQQVTLDGLTFQKFSTIRFHSVCGVPQFGTIYLQQAT